MRKTLPYLLLFLLSCGSPLLYGQPLKARLLDKQFHVALAGATIMTGSGQAVLSDKEGYFTIVAAKSDSLIISNIGYLRLSVPVINLTEGALLYLERALPSLQEIIITANPGNNLLNSIHRLDLTTRPFNNSQEILRIVPGLFIGQHAGGGKAEQLFLRGFDIDHGTDINISTDGIPVNMVSHAHGQGYADLHFMIPETIEKLDFGKGPYAAEKGDFTTAGYVALQTFNELPKNMVRVEGGMFNTLRSTGLFNIIRQKHHQNAYVAGELYLTDGPFEHQQNLSRYNLFGKHQFHFGRSTLTSQVSTFKSNWLASGQIPERAIKDGSIGWFGAIDPNEGGQTSRTNLSLKLESSMKNGASLENQVYFSRYNFELYSNFTFFKEDPVYGDEIRQKEHRNLLGYNGTYTTETALKNGATSQLKIGAGFRHDQINDLELSRTYKRNTVTAPLAYGTAGETSIWGFASELYKLNKWTANLALRFDNFNFQYADKLQGLPDKTAGKFFLSPKLNLQYQVSAKSLVFLKAGRGFHSNDVRVAVPQKGDKILPAAWGADLGLLAKPAKNLLLNMAFWMLRLDQEFIYVGDEAILEPGGKSLRTGFDLSLRYELVAHLFADMDLNYTLGRATDAPKGGQYLPLSPKFSSTGGLSFTGARLNAGLRYRWLGDRAANEDNSVQAKGYLIADANASYRINNAFSIGIVAENIFNSKWKETQFLTESRLEKEPTPVEEIHFTPGTPFFIKGRVTFEF